MNKQDSFGFDEQAAAEALDALLTERLAGRPVSPSGGLLLGEAAFASDLVDLAEAIPFTSTTTVQAASVARSSQPPPWHTRWSFLQNLNMASRSVVFKRMALALAGAAALAIVIFLAAIFVPPLWAQMTEYSKPMIVFQAPGGNGSAATSEWPGYQPVNPTYLPPGRWQFSFGARNESGVKYLVLTYLQEDRFIRISQSRAGDNRSLPKGQPRQVNDRPAALVSGLSGTLEFTTITFLDGRQITWYVGDAKIDLLSNLPESEMLQIAESLRPAEKRDAKFLLQPEGPDAPFPLSTPSLP